MTTPPPPPPTTTPPTTTTTNIIPSIMNEEELITNIQLCENTTAILLQLLISITVSLFVTTELVCTKYTI